MNDRWVRIEEELADARTAGGVAPCDAATAVPGTGGEIGEVQGGGQGRPASLTNAVLWYATAPEGSIRRPGEVLAVCAPPAGVVMTGPDALPQRELAALEGVLLDARTLALTPHADVVVLVVGRPAAAQLELWTALDAWEQREAAVTASVCGSATADPDGGPSERD